MSVGEGEYQAYEVRRERQGVEYQEARLVVSSSRWQFEKTPGTFVLRSLRTGRYALHPAP